MDDMDDLWYTDPYGIEFETTVQLRGEIETYIEQWPVCICGCGQQVDPDAAGTVLSFSSPMCQTFSFPFDEWNSELPERWLD